jgi:outer membrane protein assembly factor BamD (BamD/ComL family)
MILRRFSLIGILCGSVLLSACGAGYEWSHASTLNTIAVYQTFLSKYPNDSHAVDAQSRIAKLRDEQAWTTAQIASSLQGYQQYLTAEPNGAHAQGAREEIVTREQAAAWQTAQTNETAQSLQGFLIKYPSGSDADEARDRLKAIAGYRAEFGAARSQRRADHERDALTKRFGKELRQVVVVEPDAKDRDYRITSSPMSEQDASAACETLKHAGRPCTVVQVAS